MNYISRMDEFDCTKQIIDDLDGVLLGNFGGGSQV